MNFFKRDLLSQNLVFTGQHIVGLLQHKTGILQHVVKDELGNFIPCLGHLENRSFKTRIQCFVAPFHNMEDIRNISTKATKKTVK